MMLIRQTALKSCTVRRLGLSLRTLARPKRDIPHDVILLIFLICFCESSHSCILSCSQKYAKSLLVKTRCKDNWKFSEEGTKFAQNLIDANPTKANHGLEYVVLAEPSLFNSGETADNLVVTKPSSRRVCDAAFELCSIRPGARILLEGQGGIGKSRNLVYLLRQLLHAKKHVFYQDSNMSAVYAFILYEDIYRYSRFVPVCAGT
jgi:hypothetical protein